MFDLGNLVRSLFGKRDDEEEKRRRQSQQKQYQKFDASKLSNLQVVKQPNQQLTANDKPKFNLPTPQKPEPVFTLNKEKQQQSISQNAADLVRQNTGEASVKLNIPKPQAPAKSPYTPQKAPMVFTREAQERFNQGERIKAATLNSRTSQEDKANIAKAQEQNFDERYAPKLNPMFKQGLSYEDMAKKGGFSVDQVRKYAERNHKGYGDLGVVGNAGRAIGQFIGTSVDAATGIVRKPVATLATLDKGNRQNLNNAVAQINKDLYYGNITQSAAQERMNELTKDLIGQKPTIDEKTGMYRIGDMNTAEFAGQFAQQGLDTGSVLPFAGGAASGASKAIGFVGKNTVAPVVEQQLMRQLISKGGLQAPGAIADASAAARALGSGVLDKTAAHLGLEKAATALTAGAQTQATSRMADYLARNGVNSKTANLVGNAVTSNAKQAGVWGTAQTTTDVASGRGITPESILMNYGVDFLMGATPEIIIGSGGRLIDGFNGRVHNGLVNSNPSYAELNTRLEQTTSPTAKAAIADQMDAIRKRAQEGGFIAGPKATGFEEAKKAGRVFEGPDGKPRFEVDDSRARLTGNPDAKTLGEALDHPALYKEYEGLKDYPIEWTPYRSDMGYFTSNSFQGSNDGSKILLNSNAFDGNPSQLKRVLLHENQHSIQDLEGFASGGSPRDYATANTLAKEQLAKVNKELSQTPKDTDQFFTLRNRRDQLIKTINETQDQYGKVKDGYGDYQRLAGEAEARAVEARMDMTDAERYMDTWGRTKKIIDDIRRTNPNRLYEDSYFKNSRGRGADRGYARYINDNFDKLPEDVQAEWAMSRALDQETGEVIYGADSVRGTHVLNMMEKTGVDPRSTFYDSLDVPKDQLIVRQNSDTANFIERGRTPTNIHPEDQSIMANLIDHARGITKLSEGQAYRLELDAARVAERYGVDVPKGQTSPLTRLANAFDKRLQLENQRTGQIAYSMENPDASNPKTVETTKMADGSELVRTTDNNTGVTTEQRIVPEGERATGIVGATDVAEGYFDPAKPELTAPQKRAMRRAIDDILYEQNPELMARARYANEEMSMRPSLTEDGQFGDGVIPKLHVDDLKHYLGAQAESIPSYYKRRTGVRDIDLNAQNSFGGDVDEYLDAWLDAIEGKATNKQMAQDLRDLRRSPEVLQQAEDRVRAKIAEVQKDILETQEVRREALLAGDLETVRDADAYIAEVERGAGIPRSKPPKITSIDVKTPRGKNITEYVAVTSDLPDGKVGTELIPLDGNTHRVKDGTVIDKQGRPVGSYLAIDDAGNQYAYVEGKPVNINSIMGDMDAWGNVNKAYMDMDRLIEINAPDANTARRVQEFVTHFKDQQEAAMKTDLKTKRETLWRLEKQLNDARPKGVSRKEFSADMFQMMERKVDFDVMREKYGDALFDSQIEPTIKWSRKFLDDMLDRTNRVLVRNGYDAIPRRDNYMTHIMEDPSIWEKVGIGIQDLNPFGSSISSDVNPGRVRGGVPDEIVGNTADTGARRRWNPFAQTRRGSAHKQDFFGAMDAYLEPMLFNQYMTPASSRARVVEKAFRTYEKAKQVRFEQLAEVVGIDDARDLSGLNNPKTNKNYKADRTSPLITAWQEYGNILAGKTNAIDRVILDKTGDAGKRILGLSTKAQGIAGANVIPGSTTAALAQVLSVPQTIARDSGLSTLKAVKDMFVDLGDADPLRQSAFMRTRYTDATSKRKPVMRKYTDAASVPMNAIERAAGELSWRSAYNEALKKGFKGKAAITEADIATKKTLAGRGVGDRPMVMNSKALGPVTQFGLEVGNMGVQFWKDFKPGQKAKFMVGAAVLNTLYGAITGQTPLPDFIGASLDTVDDMLNQDEGEEDGVVDNLVQGGQRMLGEAASFIPGAPTIASMFMDDKTKETVFGEDSDMGRYGDPAISRVPKSAVEGVTGLVEGDMKKVRNSILGLVPTGNQIKRTIEGGETLSQGYLETGGGNIRTPVDGNNALNWAQGLLFGKSSLPEAQRSYENGQFLGADQSEMFKKLNQEAPNAAIEYFQSVMDKRRGSGYQPTGMSQETSALINDEDMKRKLADGTWKEVDGEIVDKNGSVQRAYYKEAAKSLPEGSEEAYKAYLKGYNIEVGTRYGKERNAKTGDSRLDHLIGLDAKSKASGTSAAGTAIALFTDSETYKNVPEWVKQRYYEDAGFTEDEVKYGAYTKLDSDTRLNEIYRPYAQANNRADLIETLLQGRRQSIYENHLMAQDSIVTQLYKEGYLTYEEQKYIKGIKIDRSGNTINSNKSSGSSSSRSKKGKGVQVADYNITLPKLTSPYDFATEAKVSLGSVGTNKNIISGVKGPQAINISRAPLPVARVR